MSRKTVLEIISSLLVVLFLYTGLDKFFNYGLFIHDMRNQPFPGWLSGLLICTVPATEILVCVLLLIDRVRMAGLWLSLFLMTLFTLYTALILSHAFPRVPCSCGGIIRSLSWPAHLLLNLFFTAISAIGLLLINNHHSKIFHGHETGETENLNQSR